MGVNMQLLLGGKREYHYLASQNGLLRQVSQKIWKTTDATGR